MAIILDPTIKKTSIGNLIMSEHGEFIDFIYDEVEKEAQEKARKIDCEITKKIRQEAIEEFRKWLLEEIRNRIETSKEFDEVSWLIKYKLFIESYNLPIK